MPNWTTTIVWSDELHNLKTKNGNYLFAGIASPEEVVDFERLLPMPHELLEVSSPADDISIFCYLTDGFKKLSGADLDKAVDETIKICHSRYMFRTREEYKEKFLEEAKKRDPNKKEPLTFASDEQITLYEKGKRYVNNVKKYGFLEWYEWAVNTWGTKWNAKEYEWICNGKAIIMDTAWNAPYGFLEKMAREYPDLTAYIMFADEDYGLGCGVGLIENGKAIFLAADYTSIYALQIAQYIHGYGYFDIYDDDEEDDFSDEEMPDDEESEARRKYLETCREAEKNPITDPIKFIKKVVASV